MTTYIFRCLVTGQQIEETMAMESVPSIGDLTDCTCGDNSYRPHRMRRVPAPIQMAEVKGTGNGPIGRGLMDRADLARKRRAEWK